MNVLGQKILPCLAALLFCFWSATLARADAISDFYAGRTINIIVSTQPGTIFDSTARAVARFLPKFVPGSPAIMVRNMPDASQTRVPQYMYAQAAKDGTYIGVINNDVPFEQLMRGRAIVRFDVRKFNWIGSAGLSNLLTLSWHTSGATQVDDLLTRELVAGATGVSSNGYLHAQVLNALLGTKIRIETNYGSGMDVARSMERGDINLRAGFSLSALRLMHPDWLRDKKVNVLIQTGIVREPSLPDVPLLQDFAKTPEQRAILMLLSSSAGVGRPFFMPPDVPLDRVEAMRIAFARTLADPDFLKHAERANLDIRYMDGPDLGALVNAIVDAPEPVVEILRSALSSASQE